VKDLSDTVLEARELGFCYSESEEGIKNNSFKIRKGEVVLLTGDSGSGKTTLLKCLNGLIPSVTEGEITGQLLVGDKDLCEMKMFEKNRFMGSVFQNPRTQFFTENTTSELVFPMENYGMTKADMDKRIGELREEFGLDGLLDRNIHTLSSGERQKVALACALALGQKLLLFDEPSANLDYGSAMRLGRIIKGLKEKGITVIVADHRFYYLSGITDKVLLMNDGSVTCYESEEEFKNSGYDTRSFDLFSIKGFGISGKEERKSGENKRTTPRECVGKITDVSYKNIVSDVSFELYKGEVAALIGSNGVGKTTLARLMCGSIRPTKGKIKTSGMPFYIMQDPDYQLFGTSAENELMMVKKDADEVRTVLESLGLKDKRKAHPFDLSGGQKQRLQIGMAVLCDRDLIIFDEPTSGLDSKSMEKVATRINGLRNKSSVLVISHDYEFIRRVADRVIYLEEGRVKDDYELSEDTLDRLNGAFREMEMKQTCETA
jgi:energy-coupling factor transport system ATP-binding protein